MQNNRFVMMILAMCMLNIGLAQDPVGPDTKTVTLLKKFRSDYEKSMIEKTPEAIQEFFNAALRLMPEFQKTIMDKPNALAYHRAYGKRFDTKTYNRKEIEILDLGSRVVEFGLFSTNVILRRTGQRYVIQGKYMDIWERSPSDDLTLVTEAWNYNHQVDIASELIFADVPTVNIAFQSHVPVNNGISFELAAYNRLQEMAVTEHNATLWSQFYTDDYLLFYSNHPPYKGRKEVDAHLADHAKQLPVFEKLDIRNDRIDDLGEYVIEYASHIAIVRNGDWSGVATGKDVRIWRREKRGALKICRGIGMYDWNY